MEQATLNDLSRQIKDLQTEMIKIKEILLEDEDDDMSCLNEEIEIAKRGKSVPHEEVVKRFCKN